MAASAKSLMRAGLISPKAGAKLAVLRGTRAQKSKMASFDGKQKDEAIRTRGEVPPNEINHPTNQRHGSRFMPSKGGSVGKGGQPTRSAIDENTGKKFPGESKVGTKAAQPRISTARTKGTIAQSGPMYGGGGRNTQ